MIMIDEMITASGEMWIFAVGGMVALAAILIAIMVLVVLPHYRKKKALKLTPREDRAAAPTRMNMKTTGTRDEFVDIMSEPNEFLRRTR
jgi:hypothetical protein